MRNEEAVYRFLELLGNVEDQYIAQAAQPWEGTSFFRGRKLKILAACAVLACVIGMTAVYHQEVRAAWEKITTVLGRILDIEEDVSSYTEIIGKTIGKDHMTVTLEEAALDGKDLWVAYSTKYVGKEENKPILLTELKINGDSADLDGTRTQMDSTDKTGIHESLVSHFQTESFIKQTDPVNMEFSFQSMDQETKTITEIGKIAFQASAKELESDTKTLYLKDEISINNDRILRLETFRYNSFGSSITGNLDEIKENEDYYLIGKDDKGNRIVYEMSNYDNPTITFRQNVMDSQYQRISSAAKTIRLQLYVLDEAQAGTYVFKKNGETTEDAYATESGKIYDEGKSPLDYASPVGKPITIQL